MKIYQNLWVGHETYFVKVKQNKYNAFGYSIKVDDSGKWNLYTNTMIALTSLKYDGVHFPIVGKIDLMEIIRQAIMKAVGVKD